MRASSAEAGVGRSTAPGAPTTAGLRRVPAWDALRVSIVAGVIVVHACVALGATGEWVYREEALSAPVARFLTVLVGILALFGLGALFYIAGLLTPVALHRHGVAGFVGGRLLRLGVPLVLMLVLVRPLLNLLMAWADGRTPSVGEVWAEQLRVLDTSGLWFVAVLLLYSLAYALLRLRDPGRAAPAALPAVSGLPGRVVAGLLVVVAIATVLVRLRWPLASNSVLDLHLWQWPQYVGMFALGVWAAENRRTGPLSRSLRLRVGWVALSAACALPAAALLGAADTDQGFYTGLGAGAWLMGAVDAGLGIGLSLWLVEVFRTHVLHATPLLTTLARCSLGAYVLQSVVLVPLALLLSPLPLPGEAKLPLLVVGGLVGSFGLAYLLAIRLRLGGRFL